MGVLCLWINYSRRLKMWSNVFTETSDTANVLWSMWEFSKDSVTRVLNLCLIGNSQELTMHEFIRREAKGAFWQIYTNEDMKKIWRFFKKAPKNVQENLLQPWSIKWLERYLDWSTKKISSKNSWIQTPGLYYTVYTVSRDVAFIPAGITCKVHNLCSHIRNVESLFSTC